MRTSNPALGAKTFLPENYALTAEPMTLQGTVNKSFILLGLTVLSAAFTWRTANGIGAPLAIVGAIGGFITCMILCFKNSWAPVLAPAYAILEGLFLGAISAFFEKAFNGIVGQAVMLTFGTFFALLSAYSTGMIKPSENFKLGIVAATGGIALVYLVTLVLSLFHIHVPFIHQGGWFGIAFSGFVVVIAALNLVLDFDFIEGGCASRAPRYMEWYAAFGLLVTLIWLYVEILRLLSKLRSR
jgi:uncharacterized YccA/Bax inhibitor family protein